MRRSTKAIVVTGAAAVVALLATASPAAAQPGSPHGASIKGSRPATTATTLLSYGGGPIVTAPAIYIVYWGSQWGSGSTITNDPAGEAPLQQAFLGSLAGASDTWSTSTTQYCQGVPVGTTQCGSAGTHVGHPSSNPVKGVWLDSAVSSPNRPRQSQIANEAIRAATHFGVGGANVEIIVDAAHGIKPSGFGTQYCAWHSATTVNGQLLPYTNMPYVSDVGATCGANFVATGGTGVNGATEGVTIVGGHEYAETLTDPDAGSGWLGGGAENGDLCAWISSGQGAAAIVNTGSANYAVQSLWSNNFNSNSGGCVIFYSSATNQH
jgi:hypothetical protein